jgi:hypothetical protein
MMFGVFEHTVGYNITAVLHAYTYFPIYYV